MARLIVLTLFFHNITFNCGSLVLKADWLGRVVGKISVHPTHHTKDTSELKMIYLDSIK